MIFRRKQHLPAPTIALSDYVRQAHQLQQLQGAALDVLETYIDPMAPAFREAMAVLDGVLYSQISKPEVAA